MIAPDSSTLRRFRKYLPSLAILVALLAIPAIAAAVPGSGPMVSNDSYAGQNITALYNTIAKICVGILIVVEGALFYAIFKFRRRDDDEQPEQVHGNLKLEVGWTLAALLIQVFIGFKTVDVMFDVETKPQGGADLVVEAIAQKWSWTFRYPKQQWRGEEIGGFTADNLVVPANNTVQLDVTSNDVLHSLYIPELGVKIDAVPGRYNYWWFNAAGPTPSPSVDMPDRQESQRPQYPTTRTDYLSFLRPLGRVDGPQTGDTKQVDYVPRNPDYDIDKQARKTSPFAKYEATEYTGMCTELCGRGHWRMYFRTVSMTPSSFEQWMIDHKREAQSGAADGATIYANNCAQCHQQKGQGDPPRFPPLVGTKWTNNKDMKDEHIKIVLQGSGAKTLEAPFTVDGTTYDGAGMTPWASSLNDAEVANVINHERTSWGNDGGTVTAEDVAEVRDELGLKPRPVVKPGQVEPAKLIEQGQKLYSGCTSCHGQDGKGVGSVPALRNSPKVLGTVDQFAETLLTEWDTPDTPGKHSPMGRSFSDKELAALMSYVRQAWENTGSPVQPPEVDRIRREIKTQSN